MLKLIDVNNLDKKTLFQLGRMSTYQDYDALTQLIDSGIEAGRDKLEDCKEEDFKEYRGIVKGFRQIKQALIDANKILSEDKIRNIREV